MPNKMKELRQEMHLTQKDVADILNIPKSSYQQYEAGIHNMRPEILVKIADFYNVTIDELLLRKTPSRYVKVSVDERRVLTAYRSLSSHDQHVIKVMLKELSPLGEEITMQQSLQYASRCAEKSAPDPLDSKQVRDFENLPNVPEDI